ncbi:MAG: SDR family oxidoreductase, partial [Planctomycetota bacterium]
YGRSSPPAPSKAVRPFSFYWTRFKPISPELRRPRSCRQAPDGILSVLVFILLRASVVLVYRPVNAYMRDNPLAAPALIPVGRFGTVDEVADVVVMLATNGYITGQTINVNGGWYMT